MLSDRLSDLVTAYISSSARAGDADVCLAAIHQLIGQIRSLLPRAPIVVSFDGPHPKLIEAHHNRTMLAACDPSAARCTGQRFGANATAAIVFAGWFVSLAATIPEAPEEAFTSFQMRETSHEEPREAIGLLLLAGWTGVLAIRSRPVVGQNDRGGAKVRPGR